MSNKNSWFKHYNKASEGQSFELLLAEQDYETIACYWWLLEQVSKFEADDNRGQCTISYSLLKRKLGWNKSRSVRVLGKINSSFQVRIEPCSEPELLQVSVPNWSELQENRGGKTLAKKDQNSDRRKKRDVRGKKKEIDNKELQIIFDRCLEKYPTKLKGTDAEARFLEQFENNALKALQFEKSIDHYKEYLSRQKNSWRAPKQTLATYLGTKSSGYFWTDFKEKIEEQSPTAGWAIDEVSA